jgi:DNA-binding SARP family transcriptional activator
MSSHIGTAPSISVLGGFEFRARGLRLRLPVTAQRVLGFLAVAGRGQRRDVVAGRLWSLTSQSRAQANLRTALWQVRQADQEVVGSARDSIWLEEHVEVDYQTMTDQAKRLLSGGIDGGDLLRVPVDLYEAELLPGWDEDWLLIDRERHRQLRMHALEKLSRRLVEAGQVALAVGAAYTAIAIEPLCESAHRALVEAFLAEGNRTEALRDFELYRRMLRDETGLAPTDEFVGLLEARVARRRA